MTALRCVRGNRLVGAALLTFVVLGDGCGPSDATETNVSDPNSTIETNVSRGDDCPDAEVCDSEGKSVQQACKDDSDCATGFRCGSKKGVCAPSRDSVTAPGR